MKGDLKSCFTVDDIRKLISSHLFDELKEHLTGLGCSFIPSFSRCSLAYGWNLKVRKGCRPVAVIYPKPGGFSVLIVIGRKEREAFDAVLPALSDYVSNVWLNSRDMNGQRWLMMDVSSPEVLSDVVLLSKLRIGNKKPATNGPGLI